MAKPPSDAPVLFDIQSDSSIIKLLKDGRFKLVLEGVEKVHWKTRGDDVAEGYRNAASYAKDFEKYYHSDSAVDAYQTFTLADGRNEKFQFTINDVKYKQKSNKLVYHITLRNKKQDDMITGIQRESQVKSTVYST